MLHNNKLKIIVSMGMSMMLTACGGSMSDLQSFVDNAFKDNKPEIEPLLHWVSLQLRIDQKKS